MQFSYFRLPISVFESIFAAEIARFSAKLTSRCSRGTIVPTEWLKT